MKKLQLLLAILVMPTATSLADDGVANLATPNLIQFENSYFYDGKGVFLQDKAKDAVMILLEHHGYPIYEGMRAKMFAVDYNTGRFADVGISGVMHVNSQTNMFVLLDFFLLPNQMVAEHWHPDGATSAAKREGWLVRWGSSYIGGIGENNISDFAALKIPKIHWGGKIDAKHVEYAEPGDFVILGQVLSKHWLLAGAEGVIVTEVANYSDSKASIRSDPKMN